MNTADGVVLRTSSPGDTRGLAAAAADAIQPGDVLSLTGELGAGKTCFAQGLAQALGVEQRVTSPTFMLVRTYPQARVPLVHCDVYRLDRLQDVLDLGDEVFAPDVVTLVEWGDLVGAILPPDHLDLEFLVGDDDESDRVVRVTGHGNWEARLGELRAAWSPWIAEAS